MWLIAGLGNPGAAYAQNRHNIGFMAADEIVRRHSSFGVWQKKASALVAEGRLAGEKTLIVKPQTFMNRSGLSVMQLMQFYKLKPTDIWVFHDELALSPGGFRVKEGGGHNGHNGLRDISQMIGDGYGRVRMGIGHPGDKNKVASYVLHDFAKTDQPWLDAMIEGAAQYIELLLDNQSSSYMNKVSLMIKENLPKPTLEEKE
ncbi:MAG: aminoacyl-tRNA hydrolase [Alphaproteobacteria bacterium]